MDEHTNNQSIFVINKHNFPNAVWLSICCYVHHLCIYFKLFSRTNSKNFKLFAICEHIFNNAFIKYTYMYVIDYVIINIISQVNFLLLLESGFFFLLKFYGIIFVLSIMNIFSKECIHTQCDLIISETVISIVTFEFFLWLISSGHFFKMLYSFNYIYQQCKTQRGLI